MTTMYHLTLEKHQDVEVSSTRDIDQATAAACAKSALPWLAQEGGNASGTTVLLCLLCPHTTCDLLAAQEHLMEQHSFTRDDLAHAIRVRRVHDESVFVWALPPQRATALQLAHLCYVRALRPPRRKRPEEAPS